MPVTRVRFVDVRLDLATKGGWIRNSSEFKSAIAAMREKNIAPHEVMEIEIPPEHNTDTSAANFAGQLNKFALSEKLPYTAKPRNGKVYVVNNADLS